MVVPMTATTPPPTTTKIKQKQIVILRTGDQLTVLHKMLRGNNSENIIFLMQSTYITGAFIFRRGDANFGVRFERFKSLLTLSVCYN